MIDLDAKISPKKSMVALIFEIDGSDIYTIMAFRS